ncbi:MAG: cytochrome C [Gammaproteobacteria bacterium]
MVPLLTGLLSNITATVVRAEDDEDERETPFNIENTVYRQECGSCHVPYPPELLSTESWTGILSNLNDHFGSDASLDDDSARQIAEFLQTNSSTRRTNDDNGKPSHRISDTVWFKQAHRPGHDGLKPGIFQSAAVKSAANCEACHRNAAAGDYSENNLRIPAPTGNPSER